jgi:hypothetical protein
MTTEDSFLHRMEKRLTKANLRTSASVYCSEHPADILDSLLWHQTLYRTFESRMPFEVLGRINV